MSSVFRGLPSVQELLESPPLKSLRKRIDPAVVVGGVRQFLDGMRGQVQSAAANIPSPGELAQRIADWIAATRPAERPAINATGAILSRELGSPPLADEAIRALTAAAGDYLLYEERPGSSDSSRASQEPDAEALAARMAGAEAAFLAGSYVGAQILSLAALAVGRAAVISRGHLLESAGGSRVADVLAAAGVAGREVGATNVTRLSDFADALGEGTAALVSVQDDGINLGAASQPPLGELAALARRHGVPLIEFLEGATLADLSAFGLNHQPLVPDHTAAGVDVVCFPGDGCLGGPSCGIIVGKRSLIERIVDHPLARALAAEKLTRAALAATLQLYEDPSQRNRAIPFFSLLDTPLDNLKHRAERLLPQLAASNVGGVEALAGETTLRGIAAPGQTLPTWRIAISPNRDDALSLAGQLSAAQPAVVCSVADGRLWIDLRSVLPRQDMQIASAFAVLGKEGPGGAARPAEPPSADAAA